FPQRCGLLVGRDFYVATEYRKPQTCRIKLKFIYQQVPGKLDRIRLEIVAKGKVPEHLKKRLMPRCLADFVEIVVLAAGAQTFLRRCGAHIFAFFQAEERILKLIHAGVGEQQRRIVGRQKRRGTHTSMPVPLEVLQKSFANLVARHKKSSLSRGNALGEA